MMPVLDLNHLLEISIKSSTLFLTNSLDWFQSLFIIIVVGHPQWKAATAKSFILKRDRLNGVQCISLHQGCCQPSSWCPVGIDCKGTMP